MSKIVEEILQLENKKLLLNKKCIIDSDSDRKKYAIYAYTHGPVTGSGYGM